MAKQNSPDTPRVNQKVDSKPRLAPLVPYIFVVGGIIGLVCSFILSYDKILSLENPNFNPDCNINPLLSCVSVMQSHQGTVFGFPNPWVGLVSFTALITVGVAMLAGGKFKRWFWLSFEAGMLAGLGFAYWMLIESIYRINALCPYCLVVDVVMIVASWYLTLYVIREGYVPMPRRLIKLSDFARRYHLEILTSWFLVIIVIILQHFWYYYGNIL